MELCKPNSENDPEFAEKIKKWEEAFVFPNKLESFIKNLKEQSFPIPGEEFLELIDKFIEDLDVEEDEFLIKSTQIIGGQEFEANMHAIKKRSESEVKNLAEKVELEIEDGPEREKFSSEKKEFEKILTKARKNQLEIKAEKKIIEKKYNNTEFRIEIDDELIEKGAHAVKKSFPKYMNGIAIASIAFIFGLAILAVWCPGCTFESTHMGELTTIETTEIISDTETQTTTIVVDKSGISFKEDSNGKNSSNQDLVFSNNGVIGNPYAMILESNIMMILVSTFVAPLAARILKEKFDIDITEKQINMIASDGMKAVTMYSREADKLRDANGHIPRKYQKTLRNKAFNALRENYDEKKYRDLVANIGVQIFDKAIEDAVQSGRLERFPLEKKQVEELIKQSIDATPQIVEWYKLDENVKDMFIEGNIRRLLQNTGANRWSHNALESVFDAEITKRVLGAALVQKENMFKRCAKPLSKIHQHCN